ncbi:MAG: 1-(5-phosphoribosyl)-5-[(5-phosphoribosylamino)methylideneamino] imidazole-4-carboxamide isomerase [Bdellovibrionales bacterium]|nr:1-(5-phosphoribosyl)-5-[(5-phosphoribosylamino)methylideneamino] imidazole-4-carboxamide isomerase [Bdellovibrionales bacterium]
MFEIIPAIDLMDGRCVRLRQGDFRSVTYYEVEALDLAVRLMQHGFRRLHLVDLDGARLGAPRHLHLLKAIAEATNLQIDLSGGVRSGQHALMALECGAQFVGVGSLALENPELVVKWLEIFGPEKLIICADVRGRSLAQAAWEKKSDEELHTFLTKWVGAGATQFMCTAIERDGSLSGPDIELYREILLTFPGINLIASGGVRSDSDVKALERLGLKGVVVGKALYQGSIAEFRAEVPAC